MPTSRARLGVLGGYEVSPSRGRAFLLGPLEATTAMFAIHALWSAWVIFPLDFHRKQLFRWRGDANRKPLEGGNDIGSPLEASPLSPLEANRYRAPSRCLAIVPAGGRPRYHPLEALGLYPVEAYEHVTPPRV